jgi:sterol desaturase/sphingolipid hydroxylase (fatty acid hydroxylase superfamily)
MLENFWYISSQVFFIFSSSILSSYFICAISNTPFYNPQLSKDKLITNLCNASLNLSFISVEVIGAAMIYYPYMDLTSHSIIKSMLNIIEYSIWIELFYYSYHRFLHSTNWYLYIHSKHHENKLVYPLDTLHIGLLDFTGMICTLIAPLLFVQVNLFEHNFIMYLYLTGAFLEHSSLLEKRHLQHHEKFKYNFCFLFPIFDYMFQTVGS